MQLPLNFDFLKAMNGQLYWKNGQQKRSSTFAVCILISTAIIGRQFNNQRLFPPMQYKYSPLYCHLKTAFQNSGRLIERMYNSYHSASLNCLQDEICYHEQNQYLKREYEEYEYENKIMMLSEYYQYHRQLPRIFQKDISEIVQTYEEDIRNLQYKTVTRKMKDDTSGEPICSVREHGRPVEKIIKNVELSYYNFQNKDIKKSKAPLQKDKNQKSCSNIAKNKKSTPNLKFYQYPQQNNDRGVHQKTVNAQHPPIISQTLKVKGMTKPKERDPFKKISLNNSNDSHKNLSRSKSKSNLATLQLEQGKRASIKPAPFNITSKNAKSRANPMSLQKTASTKNIFMHRQQSNRILKPLNDKIGQEKVGIKNMFKKVMQTKKLIKIVR